LCYNGNEVGYSPRTAAYIRNGLADPRWFASAVCDICPPLDDGDTYVSPATDDAPWFDPNVAASEEFFGIAPTRIELLPVLSRTVSARSNGGGVVGPLVPKPRVLQFTGLSVASSQAGGNFGMSWLNEVLSGTACLDGCATDEALVLPACPTDEYADIDTYLRRLIDVGVTDGPNYTVVNDLPECIISQVSFQLAAGQPYLFGVGETCMDEETLTDEYGGWACCTIETNDWPGDAVPYITLTASDEEATNIHLKGSPTFDDGYGNFECPTPEGMPCWELMVPLLPRDGVLTIDGPRKQIRYRDPSLKLDRSGIRMVSFEGPLTFPEISPCSTYCVCGTAETGTVTMSVQKVTREY
jgi:hypothetical protein